MTILTTLETIDMEPNMIEGPDAREIATDNIRTLFDQEHDFELHYVPDEITFGKKDTAGLVDAARKWNEDVMKNLMDAIWRLWPNGIDRKAPGEIELDTLRTHQLKQAVRMADNDYTPYGPFAIFWPGEFSFSPIDKKTVMSEDMLGAIERNPEDYVLFTGYVTRKRNRQC
ncbi:MAG: hypothetical protein HDQ88_08250 [Clostridia bacterium]|nr:hypothetical protein [Clostridia bacterium]